MDSSIYFLWKRVETQENHGRGGEEIEHPSIHSSNENPSICNWQNFVSVISLIRSFLQRFSLEIAAYSICSMSSLVISSTLDLFVSNRIFLILLPVLDLVSCLTRLRSCLGNILLDFSIWRMKDKNLLMRIFLRWICSDIGSTKLIKTDKDWLNHFVKLPPQAKPGSWLYFCVVTTRTRRTPTQIHLEGTVLGFWSFACGPQLPKE